MQSIQRQSSFFRHASALAFMAMMALALLICAPGGAVAQSTSVDWVVNLDDAGSDPIAAGGLVSYQLEIANDGFGTSPAPATVLTLSIPPDTILQTTSGAVTGCSPLPANGPATVTCAVPAIASQDSVSMTVGLRSSVAGTIALVASVPDSQGGAADSQPGNNTASETTTVTAGADVALSATGPANAASGETVTYVFTAQNNGPDSVTNLTLAFPIPSGFSVQSAPAGCSLSGGVYSCQIAGPLAQSQTANRSFSGRIVAPSGATLIPEAAISGGTPDDDAPENDRASMSTAVSAGSDLAITKSRSPGGTRLVGDTVTFTLSPTYSGDSPTDIVVTDTVPANYQIDSVSAPGWSVALSGQTLTATRSAGTGPGTNVPLGSISIATTAVSPGSVTNSASITATSPADPAPGNNSAGDGGTIIQAPQVDLRANQSGPSPALYVVGNSFDYRLSTSNIGNTAFAGGLTMTSQVPADLRITGITLNGWTCPGATVGDGPVSFTCDRAYPPGSPLAAGQTTPQVVLSVSPLQAGQIDTTLIVSSPDLPSEANTANNTTTHTGTASQSADSADLWIQKTAGVSSLPSGEPIGHNLILRNDGPDIARNVVVTDLLAGLINTDEDEETGGIYYYLIDTNTEGGGDSSPSVCTLSPQSATSTRLTCVIDTIPPCFFSNCPRIYLAVRPGGNAGVRTNTADILSQDTPDPDLADNTGSVNYTVTARSDIAVDKVANPSSPAVGQPFDYVVTARNLNNGLSTAENVTITDILPDGMTFLSASPSSGSCSATPTPNTTTGPGNNTVTCNLGSINTNAQRTVTIRAIANLGLQGTTVSNQVSISTSTSETITDNNSFVLNTVISDPVVNLLINKTDSVDPLQLSDITTYSISILNIGPSVATDITVTDQMPADHIAFRGHTAPGDAICGTIPANGSVGGVLECSFASLGVGESRTIQIQAEGISKGVPVNRAEIASEETRQGYEPDLSNNVATQATTVRARADVEISTLVASPATVNLRDPFDFIITLRNNTGAGLAEAEDVVLRDTLPAGIVLTAPPAVTLLGGTSSGTSCTGAAGDTTLTCDMGTLSNGAVLRIVVPVHAVTIAASGQTLTNTATVETSSIETVTSNNSNSADITINASTLSGVIFRDFGNDGNVDAIDTGISGVLVSLSGTAFDGTPVSGTTTSDANGQFTFETLPQGSYAISHAAIGEDRLAPRPGLPGSSGGTGGDASITGIALAGDTTSSGYRFRYVPQAMIGLAKERISGPVIRADGTFTVGFRLRVENFSLEPLRFVDLRDPLQGATPHFGTHAGLGNPADDPLAAGHYTIVAPPSGSCGGLRSNFDGASNPLIAANMALNAGASCLIDFAIRVNPTVPAPPMQASGGSYENLASIAGEGMWTQQSPADNADLADISNNGSTVRPGESSPTPVALSLTPAIVLVKTANLSGLSSPPAVGDEVIYQFEIRNTGNASLSNIIVDDPLLGGTVTGSPVAMLAAGQTQSLTAPYRLTQNDLDTRELRNSATVRAEAPGGVVLTDISGTGPDNDEPTVSVLDHALGVTLIKSLTEVRDTNGNGANDVGDIIRFGFVLRNTGNVALRIPTILDPIAQVTGQPLVLAPGATARDAFIADHVVTQTDLDQGFVQNSASLLATAIGSDGAVILDEDGAALTVSVISDAGTGPDGRRLSDPNSVETTDGTGASDGDPANDPTVVALSRAPAIRMTKLFSGLSDTNGNGLADVSEGLEYGFILENQGNVALQVDRVDDPTATVSGGPITLAPGASDRTGFSAVYLLTDADMQRGYVENVAEVQAIAVDGNGAPIMGDGGAVLVAQAVSDAGTDPQGQSVDDPHAVETPNGDGTFDDDPTNDPTIFSLGRAEIALEIVILETSDTNGNGVFDTGDHILYGFRVTNTGTVDLNDVTVDPASLSLDLTGFSCQPISLSVAQTALLGCTGNRYVLALADVDNQRVALSATATGISAMGAEASSDDTIASPMVQRGGLTLTKTADRSTALVGDLVGYTLALTSAADGVATATDLVDSLPAGFTYRPETARVNGRAAEPLQQGGRLIWRGLEIAAGQTLRVQFQVMVGGGAQPGAYVNRARAFSPATGQPVTAEATATVKIEAEAVFACSTIIGRVFDDANRDGYPNGDDPRAEPSPATTDPLPAGAEQGVAGVRLITPNGLAVTTDDHGRFSLPCAALPRDIGANFMLKLDTRSLPLGYQVTTENPRVVRITPGMLTKMNFGVSPAQRVQIDLSARAFTDLRTMRPELEQGLRQLVATVAATPSVLHIRYQLDMTEDRSAAQTRLREVEQTLKRLWPSGGRFSPQIEIVIERRPAGSGGQ